ncbi:hypothetical protein ACCS67_00750 [Rhizobium brockwellii]|uniref:hypothetical protein n=1 Tax=Rhizobium brockwellii TaxID=3019932 RepID=UPI003F99C752
MESIRYKPLLFALTAFPLFAADLAYGDCTFDPLKMTEMERFSFGRVEALGPVTNTFQFTPQPSGKVLIEHNITLKVPKLALDMRVSDKLDPLPDDECGEIATYDRVAVSVEPPSLKFEVDFSAAKWKCVSGDVPCPTTLEPLRFCTKQLKTRMGTGSGWVKVLLTPSVVGEELNFKQTESRDFNVSDETRFLGGLLGFLTAGSAGAAVFNVLADAIESEVKHQISLSSSVDGVNLLEIPGFSPKTEYAGFTGVSFENACTIIKSIMFLPYFPKVELCHPQQTVDLQVRRVGSVKTPMACFIHDVLTSTPH